ncbi:MAG TPA: FHA domain-containing protein [Anaerolineales bacterium]|nr:FHA domain-containing protein [Anaerolineales bacterium]
MAERLRLNLAAGLVEAGYVESRLHFRDPAGQAWSIGLRTGSWYRHGAGGWIAGESPPADLEGPAELGGLIPAAEKAGSPIPESAAATRVGPQAGLGAVGSLLKDLRASYAAGSLTSAEAAALVEELVLVEPDGTVWAPGFQSGSWFALRPAGWERAAAPPDPQRFNHALSAEHGQAALDRLHAVPDPELIAAPWRPVGGYPEALTCPACRAVQSGEKETCWNCGQPTLVLAQAGTAGASANAGGVTAEAAVPRSSTRPTWQLVLVQGSAPRPSYEIGKALSLGREADNQIQLADERASRHHARIERMGEGFRILDLGSSNGTFLNGVRLAGPTPLDPGDQVQIGDVRFVVQGPAGRCARCGSPLATGARFCGECGQPVGRAQPDASGDRTVIVQPAPGLPAVAPPAGSGLAAGGGPAPKSGRKRVLWVGLGCLALLASLMACGWALNFLGRI